MIDERGVHWRGFIDAVAAQARLLPAARQADILLAALHLAATIWGEIALLRATERLVRTHYFSLERIECATDTPMARDWLTGFLSAHDDKAALPDRPIAATALKPAWSAES